MGIEVCKCSCGFVPKMHWFEVRGSACTFCHRFVQDSGQLDDWIRGFSISSAVDVVNVSIETCEVERDLSSTRD